MKTLFFAFFVFCLPAAAQKVTLEAGIVYEDAVPFCKLTQQGSSAMPRLSVRSLEAPEEELVVAQYNTAQGLYLVSFLESGAVGSMRNETGIALLFAEDLVYNRVLVEGKVNPKGEALFLRQHQGTTRQGELIPGLKKAIAGIEDAISEILTDGPPAKRSGENEEAPYETVDRNHLKPVVLKGAQIMQDG